MHACIFKQHHWADRPLMYIISILYIFYSFWKLHATKSYFNPRCDLVAVCKTDTAVNRTTVHIKWFLCSHTIEWCIGLCYNLMTSLCTCLWMWYKKWTKANIVNQQNLKVLEALENDCNWIQQVHYLQTVAVSCKIIFIIMVIIS